MFRVYAPLLLSSGLVLFVGLLACKPFTGSHRNSSSSEEAYRQQSELIIGTRNAPTTYFIGRDGEESGFEFDLAAEFARSQGKKAIFQVYDTTEEVLQALKDGEVHFAASGLSRSTSRSKNFKYGPVYQTVQVYAICHRSHAPRQLSDLIGRRLVITTESSYLEMLEAAQESLPALRWVSQRNQSTEEILAMMNDGNPEIDCTIADSSIFDLNRNLLPQLRIQFALGESELAWPVAPGYEFLARHMETWFHFAFSSQLVDRLYEKHYGATAHYDVYDLQIFRRRIRDRLPQYEELIRRASEKSELPFELLAAVAYQESHWDPKSVSPTGVRGFMMLTLPTAESLGVTNRIDVEQSMMAGARYLRELIDRFPAFIPQEDRIWFGLASYNVGYYHLQDARRLAIDQQKNPNSWQDIKTILPLLSNKKYYSRLRYGYARGRQPVVYVRNIRAYQNILADYVDRQRAAEVATHKKESRRGIEL